MLKKQKDPARMSPRQQVEYLKAMLGYKVFAPPQRLYLDTGSPSLNGVFGSKEHGLVYGKTITLAGRPSTGKTLLAELISGLAQQDGAKLARVDLENSFDGAWSSIHGVDPGKQLSDGSWTNIALFKPQIGIFGVRRRAGATIRLQAAEEVFALAEKWMLLQRQINPLCKICMVVDSTTAIEPMEELEAGLDHQNMRTKMLAPFLNRLTKRWNSVAYNTNAIVIYISQLRTNPMQMFGNPEYIPGGGGVHYYPSVICKVKRGPKGGIIYDGATPVGLASIIKNIKNKAGGGSVEGCAVGFKAMFNTYDWRFMSPAKLKKLIVGPSKEDDNG